MELDGFSHWLSFRFFSPQEVLALQLPTLTGRNDKSGSFFGSQIVSGAAYVDATGLQLRCNWVVLFLCILGMPDMPGR